MLRLASLSTRSSTKSMTNPRISRQLCRMHGTKKHYEPVPPLPVPPLSQSLERYVNALKPLIPDDESLRKTEALVREFGADNGEGPKLQSLLLKHAEGKDNWLTDWWLDVAYLTFREGNPINVSPAIAFPRAQNILTQDDQLQYAAKIAHHAVNFRNLIMSKTLTQEGAGKMHFCMSQYDNLFGTARVPLAGKDGQTLLAKDPKHRQHIIVAHNNSFFIVPICHEDGRPMSSAQIYASLQQVVSESPRTEVPDVHQSIGLLSSEHRDTWAGAYDSIIKHDPQNRQNFEAIQNSLFLVALDQDNPGLPTVGEPENRSPFVHEGRTRLAERGLHGGGTHANSGNRWFDKTLQFFVSSDGGAGCIIEHCAAEGPAVVRLTDYCISMIEKDTDRLRPDPDLPHDVPRVEKLSWKLSKEHGETIIQAGRNFNAQIERLDLKSCEMSRFGKEAIKAGRLSPDAFIQVSFQLAYHRMYGCNAPTYESGSIRRYSRGRTETIRSASVASDAFVRACAKTDDVSVEKAELLRQAVLAHSEYSKWAVFGQGFDRHLLGLRLIAKENGIPMPPVFEDPNYWESLNFRLSTSQVPSAHESFLSFGPVVLDGYGLCYNPRPNSVLMTISSFRDCPTTDTQTFAEHLEQSMLFMQRLLPLVPKPSKL
eukprot:scpid51630/ scgid24814/ Carnitine O-acetyltransferase; Carnitine acetyltransferase